MDWPERSGPAWFHRSPSALLHRPALNALKDRIESGRLGGINLVEFRSNSLVVVILHETLESNAVEPATRHTHALRELVRGFENGIRNRDGSLHTLSMTRV